MRGRSEVNSGQGYGVLGQRSWALMREDPTLQGAGSLVQVVLLEHSAMSTLTR